MNGSRAALAGLRGMNRAAARWPGVVVGLALPATLIGHARAEFRGIEIGAQDVHADERGAFTGGLSAALLKEAGASFTIVGHSECRSHQGDTDDDVRRKVEAAYRAGLRVLLCVGESAGTRAKGAAIDTVAAQVRRCLPATADGSWLSIAYEPIWAIGTGAIPSIDEVAQMHSALRRECRANLSANAESVPLLYGGSVTSENATALLQIENVDGLLVGGASLLPETFGPIIEAAGAQVRSDACRHAAIRSARI